MAIIQGIKDLISSLGKDAQQSTTDAAARAAEQQSAEETSMAAAGGKRAHEADSSSSEATGRKKVKQSGSEEDDNLTPNYNAHPESRPISMPGRRQYNHEQDWKGQPAASQAAAKMAPARRGGGFKPMDTLGNSAAQAPRGGFFSGYVQKNPRTTQSPQANGRAQPALSRNSNAPRSSPMEHALDPVEDDTLSQQPVVKRRKVEGGKKSATVDLTDEDEGIPVATGRDNERRGSGASQVPNISKKSKNITPWAPTEQRTVESFVQVKPGSVKNVLSGSLPRLSPEAQRAAPSQRVASDGDAITVVDDDLPKTDGNASISTSSHSRELNPKKRREINLTEGWEEINEKTIQKHQGLRKPQQQPGKQPPRAYTQADERNANDLMTSAAAGRKSKPTKSSQPASTTRRSREQSHETNDGSFGSYVKPSPSAASDSASLHKKFVRDDASAPKRQTATQRMQTGSQSSPGRAGQLPNDDSFDELEGPPNIRTSTSRQVSPVKPSPAQSQANGRSNLGQFSPSSIKPTKFRESQTNSLRLPKHPHIETSDVESLQDVADHETRIGLNEIFTKSICSKAKGLELVWDDDLKAFMVVVQHEQMRNPRNKQHITIGQNDVNFWQHTKGLTGVFLKGPASQISNGNMVLSFKSVEGLNECFRMLCTDHFKTSTVSFDTMQKTYNTQRNLLIEAHKREMSRDSTAAVVPNQKLVRAAPGRPAQRQEEEQIVYENNSPPPTQPSRPTRARDRMQAVEAETLTQALDNAGYQDVRQSHQNDKASRFFENSGTRRSTRQSKSVQYEERAPSPTVEKWSMIHKPDPWAHPVLFPPEGARRVTVEFADLQRLDEEEWLNDNLVNYELKYIESQMKPEDREKVHFFNTFFFTSVSTNGNKRALNYDAVKRWTKNVDIFNTPYLVVPISENLHWFVVVICNLDNLRRKLAGPEDEAAVAGPASDGVVDSEPQVMHDGTAPPVEDHVQVPRSPGTAAGEAGSSPAAAVHGVRDDDQATATQPAADDPDGETFTFDEDGKVTSTHDHLAVDETIPTSSRPSTATGKKSKKKAPGPVKYDPEQPILIALDSFGNPRSAEMKILKQWVAAEAEDKRGMQVDWRRLQGMNAKGLPTQLNFSDCGVYLAGYIQEFAKDPQKFITKAMLKELEQEDVFADFDPVHKRDDMRKRLLQLHKEQEDERIATKKAKAAAKKGLTPQAPKVADVGKIETAQPQSSPAPRSSPAPAAPPQSDYDKLFTTGGPAAEQIQQELSSATAAGEDELPYEVPRALGAKADHDEPSDAHISSDREPVDDDDEEMLDDEDVPQPGGFRFPEGFVGKYPSREPPVDVFTQDLPVAPADTNQSSNLMDGLLKYAGEPIEKPATDEKMIINLEEDEDETATTQQLEPVIPDSQEKENLPVVEGKSDLEF